MMSAPGTPGNLEDRWEHFDRLHRDPVEVAGQLPAAGRPDPGLLRCRAYGPFWELLRELNVSLLVTREYEHLVLALSPPDPAATTYFRSPVSLISIFLCTIARNQAG